MVSIPMASLGGSHLNVQITGDGPPVVALHGFTGSSSTWEPFAAAAHWEYTIVAVDLLGHGASDSPDDPQCYSMERTIQALVELLDHLHMQQVRWLGYSLGGRIALSAAIALQQRTGGLILESASLGLATVEERAERVREDERLADWIEQVGVRWFVEYWEALPLWASQARLPAATRESLKIQRLHNNPRGLANSLRGVGTGAQPPLHDRVGQSSAPTLFIAGAEDAKFTAIAQEMHRAVALSSLHIIPDAGHAAHLEKPELFNQVVLEFLRTNG